MNNNDSPLISLKSGRLVSGNSKNGLETKDRPGVPGDGLLPANPLHIQTTRQARLQLFRILSES
ncbi:MAG: hypothetical protein JEZ10_00285 [Verrucomicrobia bacterium]|nr:hypothetical protein [Verrucomicrobiota bacterium]